MGTVRCFVALELPAGVRQRLTALLERLSREHPEFRWVAPDTLHLTLKFLGDVEEQRLPEVEAAIKQAVGAWAAGPLDTSAQAAAQPLQWSLHGAGTFPGRGRRARVIWLGLQAGRDLLKLQQAVDESLAACGFIRADRPSSQHLTLARSRSPIGEPAPWVDELAGETFGDVQSEQIVVFRSTLTPSGPIYTPLAKIPLS
ncbi:MAG: RNA 2',3'-cyclic phosphodiesterase [Symbiobacteriia bacterium]